MADHDVTRAALRTLVAESASAQDVSRVALRVLVGIPPVSYELTRSALRVLPGSPSPPFALGRIALRLLVATAEGQEGGDDNGNGGDVTPPEPTIPPDLDAPDDDLADDCVEYSTRLVNQALSRIHVSKQLANVATDLSEEAAVARLHYTPDVNCVLADFPWPFATRYADLELIDVSGGSDAVPVNRDWQYAYRAPELMIFARRIVPQNGSRRAYDPSPIKFRLGTDADGVLIYCNEAATDDVPVELEYTVRPICPALMGGPAFRSACAWRLASSLAGPLARDVKLVAFCLEMYAREIANAKAQAANESQPDPDGDAAWISGRD